MSEDWDLFAVVRSCSSSVSTASNHGGTCKQQDPPPPPPLFPHIPGDSRDRESSSSSSCNELQDSCKPFLPVTTTTTWSSPVSNNVVMKQEQGVLESVDHKSPLAVRVFPASTSSSVFVFKGQRDQLPPLRSRKRKNQQKRTICHVTQENLSSDMWAWRKYGQKPIKGSPYPRNYYRCSSSKGCLARKQVERSNLDPNIFIVTYTGEHTHPRPTHRNSLAGSTRNKSSQPLPKPDDHPSKSSSDAVKEESIIHLSPTTPLNENDDVQGDEQVNKEEDEEFDEEEDDVDVDVDDDDVDHLLIPNLAVRDRDDLFFTPDFTHWSAGSVGDGGG